MPKSPARLVEMGNAGTYGMGFHTALKKGDVADVASVGLPDVSFGYTAMRSPPSACGANSNLARCLGMFQSARRRQRPATAPLSPQGNHLSIGKTQRRGHTRAAVPARLLLADVDARTPQAPGGLLVVDGVTREGAGHEQQFVVGANRTRAVPDDLYHGETASEGALCKRRRQLKGREEKVFRNGS